MRRRLVVSTTLVVAIVLVILALPVTLLLRDAATNELQARTELEALAVADALRDDLVAGQTPDLDDALRLVSDGDGIRVFAADDTVLAEIAVDGIESPFRSTVSGPDGTRVQVVTSSAESNDRFRSQLIRLSTVALFAIVVAAMLAWVQARQLASPLERLARAAARVGDGDFTVASPGVSGIDEIDAISRAMRLSANRVERMLESERGFTADATHQLRTGLTGLAMRLEILERHPDPEVAADAGATLTQIHELNTTLDELLKVARKGSTGERRDLELVALVRHHVADWEAQYAESRRQVVVTAGPTDSVFATPGLIGQILDVLLENSLRHGRGTAAVLVHGTSVTLEDEGNGIDEARAATLFDRPADHLAAHGRGLALARRLAEADGGRLELVQLRPATFRLTLLASDPERRVAERRATPRDTPDRRAL